MLGYLYWGGEGFTWGRGQGIRLGIGIEKREGKDLEIEKEYTEVGPKSY